MEDFYILTTLVQLVIPLQQQVQPMMIVLVFKLYTKFLN